MKQTWKTRWQALLLAVLLLPEFPTANRVELFSAQLTQPHFLGEHVRLSTSDGAVEQQLLEQCLQGQHLPSTVELQWHWETEDGTEIGTGERLEQLTPAESKAYCLTINLVQHTALGEQTVLQTQQAWYYVPVISGTITVKVHAEKKAITPQDRLQFLARKDTGEQFSCIAAPETDPETGAQFLAGQFTGLPYGKYTVTPIESELALYTQPAAACALGCWDNDDTVSTHRAHAQVVFRLAE